MKWSYLSILDYGANASFEGWFFNLFARQSSHIKGFNSILIWIIGSILRGGTSEFQPSDIWSRDREVDEVFSDLNLDKKFDSACKKNPKYFTIIFKNFL